MTDIPDLPPVLERLLEGGEHDAVGAYALDALPSAERAAFETHLAQCAQCQSELVLLRQSADILRRALVPDGEVSEVKSAAPPPAPEPAPAANGAAVVEGPPLPEGTVAEETIAEARADGFEPPPMDTATLPDEALLSEEAETTSTVVDETAPVEAAGGPATEPAVVEAPVSPPAEEPAPLKPPRKMRPRGRVAPGVQPAAEVTAAAQPARRSRLPWVVGALGLTVGVIAILAALSLAEMKGNLEDEIDFQNAQIAELNAQRDLYLEQTSAITWTLAPTTIGAPGSTAVVYADPSGTSAILSVTGMNPLGSDQVYQVWYLPPEGGGAPVAGPVFSVDDSGGAVLQIAPDLSPYEALAITIEPEGGSEEATSNPVIQGFISVQ